ncbi:cold shock domain-containing protein [Sutcliffiella horikoshii]|uniref:cold shock domain-containing protein n=1 Tax=Sutcliffiella horikoshii TaxID=79883 RepID=UPI003CF2323A
MEGTIIKYNNEKGYGFIKGTDGKDYFFHVSHLKKSIEVNSLKKESDVIFEIEDSIRGKRANNIKVKTDYRTEHIRFRNNNGRRLMVNFKGENEEVRISEKIHEILKITFSREESFKNSSYTFNFLQPSERYRESFNMFNEVLMLFSKFTFYDDRAMDYVDKLFMDYSNRLDPVVIVLISKDRNIKEIIRRHNTNNHESRIIVPFTYEEILHCNFDEKLFQSRLREFFYQRDLFAMESPLNTDSYFFGRSNIVHNFFDKYSIGEQTGLFGLRKTGKTSVLFALRRLVRARKGISVYVDCQNPSIYKLNWYELLQYLIELTTKEIKEQLELDITIVNKEYDEKNAGKNFLDSLQEIHGQIGRRILFIFDEIEHITFDLSRNEDWKNGESYLSFWQTIRSIIQTNQSLCSFVIAGVNPRIVEEVAVKGYDNPIFNNINPTYLNLFTYEDVKTMVSEIGSYMGLKFEEGIYHKLFNDYGGHPFLIRNVCSMINSYFKERPYTITNRDYDDYKESIDKRLIPYIKSILFVLENWYPIEFEILKDIALENKLEYKLKIQNDEAVINHLMGYGILIQSSNNNYYIEIDAIRNYMRSNFKNETIPDERDEIRELISSRRDNIERKLRTLVKQTFLIKYGPGPIPKIIEKYTKDGFDSVINRRKGNDIFEGLYFSELKNVIFGEYSTFSNIITIDKAIFMAAMNKINDFRHVDAHAGNVTREEYKELHIYFSQLEKLFDAF